MQVSNLDLLDVKLIEPKVFGDDRGFFYESFNQKAFETAIGYSVNFVQDNHSRSSQGVLRGLHYQIQEAQGKLVRVAVGTVLDVAVDIRQSSPTFGQSIAVELSAENKRQLWIPAGFAHGFIVLSDYAEFLYKTTTYYAPQFERCIRWDDPDLAIDWHFNSPPKVSEKDANGSYFKDAELFS